MSAAGKVSNLQIGIAVVVGSVMNECDISIAILLACEQVGEGVRCDAEPKTVHVEVVVYLVIIHIQIYIQTLTVRTDVNHACLG